MIEDHGDQYSLNYLEKEGFSSDVLDALKLLTHDENIPYMEYIKNISENPIAAKVKLADLNHNTDIRRVDGKKTKKYDTYLEAIDYLKKLK